MTDSGNSSGSSTAGDEEFDSRAGSSSISAFLNNHASDSLQRLPPQPQPPHQLHPSPMFDPLSNFFDPLTRSLDRNLDMAIWAKSHPRPPEPQSCTGDLSGFGIPQMQPQTLSGSGFSAPDISKQVASASDQATGAVSNSNIHSNAPRNTKKRSRASRRAPTTVLSTDTANFRAMVQEFTGIPDGPFAASPFQRSRLDLFGSAASGSPSYLLRPFAQKIQPPPPPSFISSPPPPSNANASTANNFPTLFGTLASSPNPSPNTTTNSSQSLLSPNVQNPILDFQSLFQSPNKYLPTCSIFSNKSLEPDHSKPGGVEEFELGQPAVNTQLRAELPDVDSTLRANNWSSEPTVPNHHGGINIFRSLDGNFSNLQSPRVGSGPNVGYSNAPPLSSEFNGDQGTENNNNTGSKGEGIVESWICSSDYN